ncbi:hypothetical protein MTO96_005001 [Rhipicephalus appendiculatus]
MCASHPRTVAFGKHIYVIGGYDGRGQVTSVERYDTDLDVWEMVAPPQHTKKCAQCRRPGRQDLRFRWLRWPGVPVYCGSLRPHNKCVDHGATYAFLQEWPSFVLFPGTLCAPQGSYDSKTLRYIHTVICLRLTVACQNVNAMQLNE